jgi:hypothetical protein
MDIYELEFPAPTAGELACIIEQELQHSPAKNQHQQRNHQQKQSTLSSSTNHYPGRQTFGPSSKKAGKTFEDVAYGPSADRSHCNYFLMSRNNLLGSPFAKYLVLTKYRAKQREEKALARAAEDWDESKSWTLDKAKPPPPWILKQIQAAGERRKAVKSSGFDEGHAASSGVIFGPQSAMELYEYQRQGIASGARERQGRVLLGGKHTLSYA